MSHARPFYEMVYHREDWQLADAFRPMPPGVMWGCRRFTAPASVVAGESDATLLQAAKDAAPEGYRLTKLSLYPEHADEHVIWKTAPDKRMEKTAELSGGSEK